MAQGFDLAGTTNTVGAPFFAWHDKPHGTSSIAARPCKVRKDGAPTVRNGKEKDLKGWATRLALLRNPNKKTIARRNHSFWCIVRCDQRQDYRHGFTVPSAVLIAASAEV